MKDLHGGNIYKFQREGKNNILDYSSNINPLGVPQKFIDIAKENFDKFDLEVKVKEKEINDFLDTNV